MLRYRRQWIRTGAKWFLPEERPEVWILEDQLALVPVEYPLELADEVSDENELGTLPQVVSLIEKWKAVVELERSGLRREAIVELHHFIDACGTEANDSLKVVVKAILSSHWSNRSQIPLRMPLLQGVIGPMLLAEYEAGNHDGILWLARLNQELRGCRKVWDSLVNVTSAGLWRLMLAHDPSNEEARVALRTELVSIIKNSLHELPSGVVDGHMACTIEGCQELLQDVDELEKIANQSEKLALEDLMRRARFHYKAYAEYLASRPHYEDYPRYLMSVHGDWPD